MHGYSTRPGGASIRRPVPRVPHSAHIISGKRLAKFLGRSGQEILRRIRHDCLRPASPFCSEGNRFCRGKSQAILAEMRGRRYDRKLYLDVEFHRYLIASLDSPICHAFALLVQNIGDPKKANSAALCLSLRWEAAGALPRMLATDELAAIHDKFSITR